MSTITVNPAVTIVTENFEIYLFNIPILNDSVYFFLPFYLRGKAQTIIYGSLKCSQTKDPHVTSPDYDTGPSPESPLYPLLFNPTSSWRTTTWILTQRFKRAVSDIHTSGNLHFCHLLRKSDLTAFGLLSLGRSLGK